MFLAETERKNDVDQYQLTSAREGLIENEKKRESMMKQKEGLELIKEESRLDDDALKNNVGGNSKVNGTTHQNDQNENNKDEKV